MGPKEPSLEKFESEIVSKMSSLDTKGLVDEQVHYFKHIQDVVWEDHKPPTTRAGVAQNLNYLRMSYLVKKMMKYSKQPKRRNLQNDILTDETKIAGTTWAQLRPE